MRWIEEEEKMRWQVVGVGFRLVDYRDCVCVCARWDDYCYGERSETD